MKSTDIFEMLSDENRLKIVKALLEKEYRVTDLLKTMKMPFRKQSLISHHLKKMREKGLVNGERKGREIIYSLIDFNSIEKSIIEAEAIVSLDVQKRVGSLVKGK